MFIRPGTDLRRIAGIIWDFDDVLYDVADFPPGAFVALHYEAKMLTACALLPPMTFEEAVAVAQPFIDEGKNPLLPFFPLAEARGLNKAQFRDDVIRVYHEILHAVVRERYPHVLAPKPDLVRAFAAAHGLKHGILSHSHINGWARPGYESIGLLQFFNDAHTLGLNQLGTAHKAKGSEAITLALQTTGLAASEAAFVEDEKRHLQIAKEKYPDLVTVWKTALGDAQEDYMDVVIRRPEDLLNAIVAARL